MDSGNPGIVGATHTSPNVYLAETVPGVTTDIQIPEGGNRYPTLTVRWDEAQFKMKVQASTKAIPRIAGPLAPAPCASSQ